MEVDYPPVLPLFSRLLAPSCFLRTTTFTHTHTRTHRHTTGPRRRTSQKKGTRLYLCVQGSGGLKRKKKSAACVGANSADRFLVGSSLSFFTPPYSPHPPLLILPIASRNRETRWPLWCVFRDRRGSTKPLEKRQLSPGAPITLRSSRGKNKSRNTRRYCNKVHARWQKEGYFAPGEGVTRRSARGVCNTSSRAKPVQTRAVSENLANKFPPSAPSVCFGFQ